MSTGAGGGSTSADRRRRRLRNRTAATAQASAGGSGGGPSVPSTTGGGAGAGVVTGGSSTAAGGGGSGGGRIPPLPPPRDSSVRTARATTVAGGASGASVRLEPAVSTSRSPVDGLERHPSDEVGLGGGSSGRIDPDDDLFRGIARDAFGGGLRGGRGGIDADDSAGADADRDAAWGGLSGMIRRSRSRSWSPMRGRDLFAANDLGDNDAAAAGEGEAKAGGGGGRSRIFGGSSSKKKKRKEKDGRKKKEISSPPPSSAASRSPPPCPEDEYHTRDDEGAAAEEPPPLSDDDEDPFRGLSEGEASGSGAGGGGGVDDSQNSSDVSGGTDHQVLALSPTAGSEIGAASTFGGASVATGLTGLTSGTAAVSALAKRGQAGWDAYESGRNGGGEDDRGGGGSSALADWSGAPNAGRGSRALSPSPAQSPPPPPARPSAVTFPTGVRAGGGSSSRRDSQQGQAGAGGTAALPPSGPPGRVIRTASTGSGTPSRTHRRVRSNPSSPPPHASFGSGGGDASSLSVGGTSTTAAARKIAAALNRSIHTPDPVPYVQVRPLDLAGRAAFERMKLPTRDELASVAKRFPDIGGSGRAGPEQANGAPDKSASLSTKLRKVSPSPQHVEILERLHSQHGREVRQLCWSPAVSPHADPWGGWDTDEGSTSSSDGDGGGVDNDNTNGGRDTIGSKARAGAAGQGVAMMGSDSVSRRRRLLARKRRRLAQKRTGRAPHRPIDAFEYAASALPDHVPPLTNRRRRLPLRSDVGFPGATEGEVRAKQLEIVRETELEEHSPRIVVLVGSGDVGGVSGGAGTGGAAAIEGGSATAVGGAGGRAVAGADNDVLSVAGREVLDESEGLPDVPLAGGDLVEARLRHARAVTCACGKERKNTSRGGGRRGGRRSAASVARPGSSAVQNDAGGKTEGVADSAVVKAGVAAGGKRDPPPSTRAPPGPDPTSTFAPPIDSTYSSTQLWRPRPFSDRPAGMVHALSIPLDVRFDAGDIEPLVCTLALYCLPSPPSSASDGGGSSSSSRASKKAWAFRGKISEDFTFPAGDWRGLLREEAGISLARHFGTGRVGAAADSVDELVADERDGLGLDGCDDDGDGGGQRWRRKTRKALFSYDPLALPESGGKSTLHVVMQVHKVTQAEAASAYLTDGGSNSQAALFGVGGLGSAGSMKKKSISKRLKKTLSRSKSLTSKEAVVSETTESTLSSITSKSVLSYSALSTKDMAAAQSKAMAVFETHGTEFMTPICFGVLPLFPDVDDDSGGVDGRHYRGLVNEEEMEWPNGFGQTMQLYSYPHTPESQDEFVERLANMTEAKKREKNSDSNSSVMTDGTDSQEPLLNDESVNSAAHIPTDPALESPSSRRRTMPMPVLGFKSSKNASASPLVPGKMKSGKWTYADTPPIAGTATFFNSVLGVDFTQALLQTPDILASEKDGAGTRLPRLLVDVSGDCAIMMNPETSSGSRTKKRSNLVRLPPSKSPSGYSDSFEIREVLYLPPRPERLYDSDVPICSSTVLNLLYLYPRQLRLVPEEEDATGGFGLPARHGSKNAFYSVRIRLVQEGAVSNEETGVMETVYTPLDSMYNPAPGGQSMLKAVFTKIPHSTTGDKASGASNHSTDIIDVGIPIRDEVKVRLPTVLDGSHFLQFSLFFVQVTTDLHELDDGEGSVNGGSGGLVSEAVSETLIPLSSSASREPSSKVRVATIIPNGVHRIKLDSFQLQVESRLVSSIHSSDPGVATVLRDFPYAKEYAESGSQTPVRELGIFHSRSSVGNASSAQDATKIVSFRSVIANASEQAIISHFHGLVFLHMCNLLNNGPPEFAFRFAKRVFRDDGIDSDCIKTYNPPSSATLFLMNNIRSLFEILHKAKARFGGEKHRQSAMRRYFKDFMDTFDESLFSSQPEEHRLQQPSTVESFQSDEKQLENSQSSQSLENMAGVDSMNDMVLEALEDKLIEAAVHIVAIQEQVKTPRSSVDLKFYPGNRAGMVIGGIPFSRTAYGASKTDRMRAEAELYEAGTRLTELFDDDETVVTTATHATLRSRKNDLDVESSPARSILETPDSKPGAARVTEGMRQWGLTEDEEEATLDGFAGPSIFSTPEQPETDFSDKFTSTPFSFASEKAKSMAQRINTVAQVVMTPCMAPNLSAILATRYGNSPSGSKDDPAKDKKQDAKFQQQRRISPPMQQPERYHVPVAPQAETKETVIRHPGSDIEEEDESIVQSGSEEFVGRSDAPRVKLRGYQTLYSTRLECSVQDLGDETKNRDNSQRPFLYECIFALWLQAWLDHSISPGGKQQRKGSKRSKRDVSVESETLMMFTANVNFLLPICLKSLVFRCSATSPIKETIPSTILDGKHMQIFEPLVEVLARSLVSQALSGEVTDDDAWDKQLVLTLSSNDVVMDFLVGLLSIIHPAQASLLIFKYFRTLRSSETADERNGGEDEDSMSSTTFRRLNLRRVRCSRSIRLRAAERLAALPKFVALNYPYRYAKTGRYQTQKPSSWTKQGSDGKVGGAVEIVTTCSFADGFERLPHAHWLAELLTNECFSICSESCEAVVAEAMAQIKASQHEKGKKKSALKSRRGIALSRSDLLRFQSTALHAVSIAYELLLRRHAIDERFQTEETQGRIAAMFVSPILSNSIKSAQWLARMESTHKVRTLWLLSFLHVLQEAPEIVIREKLRLYCTHQGYPRLHRFIRVLRLCSSTCQGFMTEDKTDPSDSVILRDLSPWLVQESFNTICAATNMLVDECAGISSSVPHEQKKMAQGVFDVLLHVITTPQSSVTHLRALGGASQALDKFGVVLFLEVVGDSLQHWARMCSTLMNSTSLSVRSIAVDFFVSLVGGFWKEGGNIDEVALVFLTIMPEVVAREIALFAVSGCTSSMADVESSVWPLRRALADIEETNPVDDNRLDPAAVPFLATFCRTCQAVIDGVLIELRLKGDHCVIVGSSIQVAPEESAPSSPTKKKRGKTKIVDGDESSKTHASWRAFAFDADEESLFEAASIFLPETAPLQRLRWLLTLKSLHEAKGQWVEAAETLVLCAKTIADAIPHIKSVWRPSRFVLWHDDRRSLWLSTVGKEIGLPDRGNTQVMEFADSFLEAPNMIGTTSKIGGTGMLERPTVPALCRMLGNVAKEAVEEYLKEEGMESLAFLRLEQLLKVVMGVIEEHSAMGVKKRYRRNLLVEENAALRKMSASLNGHMTRLAERMLLLAEDGPESGDSSSSPSSPPRGVGKSLTPPRNALQEKLNLQYYVRVELVGKKPSRFMESTSLPTFLEWENPSICRVPKDAVARATAEDSSTQRKGLKDSLSIVLTAKDFTLEERVCASFAEPLLLALSRELSTDSIVFSTERPSDAILGNDGDSKTFLTVSMAHVDVASMVGGRGNVEQTKRFLFKKTTDDASAGTSSPSPKGLPSRFVEHTVAQEFPCTLSRQRTLITSEFFSSSS